MRYVRRMTHDTFVAGLLLRNKVAQQKLRVSYLVAESCNKLRNKNTNRDQLYFSATYCRNAER